MNIPHYEIFIRNNNFEKIGVIKNYTHLSCVNRYNDEGGFIIVLPHDGSPAQVQLQNLFHGPGGHGGIVVTLEGSIVFSGSIEGFEQTGEYFGGQDQERIVFYGVDDTALLGKRICMTPFPNIDPPLYAAPANQGFGIYVYPQSAPPPAPQTLWPASRVMYRLAADNIGFRAPYNHPPYQDREIRSLWVKRPGWVGPNFELRVRYQNLLQKLQEVANYIPQANDPFWQHNAFYTGLGFKISQLVEPIVTNSVTNNQIQGANPNVMPLPENGVVRRIQFEVYEPRNLSDTVIFSEGFRNIGRFRYRMQAPQSNYITLGGMNTNSDDPTTRWFSHLGHGESINQFGLKETFLDRRDIQYDAPIQRPPQVPPPNPNTLNNAQKQYMRMYNAWLQAIQTELYDKRPVVEFEIDTINTSPTRYPQDYRLGDLVTVIPPGEPSTRILAKVRAIEIVLSKEEGEVIKTTLGTENVRTGVALFDKLKTTTENVNHLEQIF